MEPLKFKVNPAAQFRMQPCQFVREIIHRPLKDCWINSFLKVFWSVTILAILPPPLVIVNNKEGGIRMAVDYREVNLQLETTAN